VVLGRKILKFDLGHIVMTVFEPIASQHFETTLFENNLVSNPIKRDHWIAIIFSEWANRLDEKQNESLTKVKHLIPNCLLGTKTSTVIEQHRACTDEP